MAPATAGFLTGPENHPHGAARPEAKLFQQAHGLPGSQGTAAVVHRTLPDVPGVDVAADDDDLFRSVGSRQLRHDVARGSLGQHAVVHRESHHYGLTPAAAADATVRRLRH
jgi:hypothetical protein